MFIYLSLGSGHSVEGVVAVVCQDNLWERPAQHICPQITLFVFRTSARTVCLGYSL